MARFITSPLERDRGIASRVVENESGAACTTGYFVPPPSLLLPYHLGMGENHHCQNEQWKRILARGPFGHARPRKTDESRTRRSETLPTQSVFSRWRHRQ